MAADFEVIGEDNVYSSQRFTVARIHVRTPEGDQVDREVVRHPGAVSVVALKSDMQTVVMVRQFRASIGRKLLELPAGTRDVPGEDPLETAKRELREETGIVAVEFVELAEFLNSPGTSDQGHIVYLATGLTHLETSSQTVEEQHMEIESVRLDQVTQLVSSGVITDAKSIIGLFMARELLADGSQAFDSLA